MDFLGRRISSDFLLSDRIRRKLSRKSWKKGTVWWSWPLGAENPYGNKAYPISDFPLFDFPGCSVRFIQWLLALTRIVCWIAKQLSGTSFGSRKDRNRRQSAYFLDARSGICLSVGLFSTLLIHFRFEIENNSGFWLIRLWLWNNGASKLSFLEALRPICRSRRKPRVVISISCLWLRKRPAWFLRGNPRHPIYQCVKV